MKSGRQPRLIKIRVTVIVSPPYHPAADSLEHPPSAQPSISRGPLRRVLCVDDDPLILSLIDATLTYAGFEVRVASGGAQALTIVAEAAWRPDLALLDVLMPGMDGPEVATALARLPHGAGVPVIFLTASNRAVDTDRYRLMGALGVVGKPLNPLELADTVQRMWQMGGWS